MQYPPIEIYHQNSLVWQVKSAAEEQKRLCLTMHDYVSHRTAVNNPFVKTNRWTVILREATCSFIKKKKKNPLNDNTVAKSMTSISVLNWEGSQLTIPSFLTPSTCFLRRLCCFFLWIFAAGYWPTELLLEKPHLSKAGNKTAPGRLVPGHQNGTFSSAFFPVCACVSVCFLAPRGCLASLR